MSSTINLQTTVNITKKFVYNTPLLYVNDGDLVYSMADSVRQFILSPPFAWRWNRGFYSTTLSVGTTDYKINVSDFGWIEKATIFYPAIQGSPQKSIELTVSSCLVEETILGQPAYISIINDDNNGNITLRVLASPDQQYQLYIIYQKSAPSFSSLSDFWEPIPDYYRFIYEQGFLAKAYEYKGDERFAYAHTEFLKSVVATNDGLTDEQKNIFLGPRLVYQRETQNVTQSGSIARQGRVGG